MNTWRSNSAGPVWLGATTTGVEDQVRTAAQTIDRALIEDAELTSARA